ncbi:MAG: molybdopterin-dependent oxidoreductase [Thermoplasmata archaeon]
MIDFPLWLRVSHLINAILIIMMMRSGLEILSAHPKLYTNDNALDGSEWIKFTKKKMPKDRLWTSSDEDEAFPSWLALPGRSNLGLGRHWHFFSLLFWVANGVVFYVLLFATGLWTTLIPTSWSFFPQVGTAISAILGGHLPPAGHPFDAVQQLTYAGVIFVLAPLMVVTGPALSPAVGARFPWYPKLFGGRQGARTLHFLGLVGLVLFVIVHLTFVVIDGFQQNIANIVLGGGMISLTVAVVLFLLYLLVVIAINLWESHYSLGSPRKVQVGLDRVIAPVKKAIFGKVVSRQNRKESEISPYFRVNGRPPETTEYRELLENSFSSWRLRVYGLVDHELSLSLGDLRAMRKETQITEHSCIQGWTAIGKWAGVPVSFVLRLCGPKPNARYAVFHSMGFGERDQYGHGEPTKEFYEVIDLELAGHHQTILAYEMNGKNLPIEHGAPLRLRVETQLGFKMVKWLRSIELVDDYRQIFGGLGGYREDVQHFAVGAPI